MATFGVLPVYECKMEKVNLKLNFAPRLNDEIINLF